jgi:S1-C subfamily serine protease
MHRGYLGLRSQPVELDAGLRKALGRDQETGLLLVGIEEGGPTASAGLLLGDMLVAFAGQPVEDHRLLVERLHSSEAGQRVELQLLRAGKPLTVSVTLGQRPAR